MANVLEENMEANENAKPDDDMEEGELSDDGMEQPETASRPQRMGIRMEMPDLLKEIGGADFNTVDAETVEKISARALRFQTGNAISFQEVSALYSSLQVSQDERNSLNRCEMIHVWGQEKLDLADIQHYFKEYHPLNVEVAGRNTANVIWATAANCARAMLALSKGIGEAGTERVVKHVLDGGEERSVVTETEVGEDLVHPEDIGIEIPDGGPWRLGNTIGAEGVLLLRFGRKTDVSLYERRVTARNVGILSKSKRDELMLEQHKAAQREMELKKPVDKKNPWGIVAETWAGESRGRTGRDFDDYVDNLNRGLSHGAQSSRRDWDAPGEKEIDGRVTARGRGNVRDRLDWGNRVEQDSDDQAETFIEKEDEEMDWGVKMKRPRMGMVADIVEKKGSAKSRLYGSEAERKETIKRKVPNSKYARTEVVEEDEEEMDSTIVRRVDVEEREERVFKTAGRRLTDRFMGGRLEGRVGLGKSEPKEGAGRLENRMEGRIGGKLEGRLGRKNRDSDSGDSLERDNGADLRQNLASDLVIQVTQSDEDEFDREEMGRRDGRRNEEESRVSGHIKESELRNRLKEKQREKDRLEDKEKRDREKIRALKEKEEQLTREKHRQERRDREREKESILRRKEKEKKRNKHKSQKKYSSDEDSDSESEESESGSDSSGSSESESDSSDSDSDSSSSDSQADKKKKKHKIVSQKKKEENKKDRARDNSSRSHRDQSKSDHKKSGKKDSAEELKKASELRDKLKNYLKKAKEAKENKKK
eukprot:GFUD01014677.1.p1 GENE.GFUD01014677.1~~GFUD01014677.1.p1  ORF type:complete len:765 (+),score=258.77 GFUD01014677.1:54-2348(+)